ncbi:unnamed protein product [Adineta steineri]|uniref:Uncharacterized protein n=1 Tax=Adineta steineri TaxID=433720 RepID=A0A814UIW6_9BILA|nr:unnamed protein product [Adineta steineri]CAF3614067.1 unnamed protein product [Adineta steineri]
MTSTNSANRKSKRDDPKRSSAPITVVAASEQQVTKTKNAVKPNEAVVLTQTSNTISNKKRRATEIIQNEVPLAERLNAFENQTSTGQLNTEQKQQSLSADSLVTLLTQGLQSSDTTLLDVSSKEFEKGKQNAKAILIYFFFK